MHCFRAPNATVVTEKKGKQCHQEELAVALILSFTQVTKQSGQVCVCVQGGSNQISLEYTPVLAKGFKTFLTSPLIEMKGEELIV